MTPEFQERLELWHERLGVEKIYALTLLFENLSGQPPRLDKLRFRANRPDLIKVLDTLAQTDQLIKESSEKNEDGSLTYFYTLTTDALMAVHTPSSHKLFRMMEKIFIAFRNLYVEDLGKARFVEEFTILLNIDEARHALFLDALYYMRSFRGISFFNFYSVSFPYGKVAQFSISEAVIEFENFWDAAGQYLPRPPSEPSEEIPQSLKQPSAVSEATLETLKSIDLSPLAKQMSDASKLSEEILKSIDLSPLVKQISAASDIAKEIPKSFNLSALTEQLSGASKLSEEILKSFDPSSFTKQMSEILKQFSSIEADISSLLDSPPIEADTNIPEWNGEKDRLPKFKRTSDDVHGGIPVIALDKWEDFGNFVASDFFDRDDADFIFRGQRRFDWNLSSSLARLIGKRKISKELTEAHLKEFKKALRGRTSDLSMFDADSRKPQKQEQEVWALGQHQFLRTPLIDWTKSLYVALFFAFTDEDEQEMRKNPYRAVFMLDRNFIDSENASPSLHSFEPRKDEQGRLVSQAGLFTYADEGKAFEATLIDSLTEYMNENGSDGQVEEDDDITAFFARYVCKILIPNIRGIECLKSLERMNIHHASLFPDLFGAAQFTNYQTRKKKW